MSVPVETEPSFRHGNAEPIFEYHVNGDGRSYNISPNSERFLVVQEVEKDDCFFFREAYLVVHALVREHRGVLSGRQSGGGAERSSSV